MEQGKPDAPLFGGSTAVRRAIGQRVKEAGESECRSVMERIGIATSSRCESRQTSSWSWLTRELTESSREEIANERGAIYVCSLRPGDAMEQIDWTQCELKVRRLQERIVKATQEAVMAR